MNMVKTITVTEKAYNALAARKGPRSFSETILDITEPKRGTGHDLLRFMATHKPIGEKAYREMKAAHERFRREFHEGFEARQRKLWGGHGTSRAR